MALIDEEERRRAERAHQVALFRYQLIREAADMTEIEVRFNNRPFGLAIPHRISRHAHPKAKPEVPQAPPAPSTGIDYLRLVDTARTTELGQKINYTALMPGQQDEDQ